MRLNALAAKLSSSFQHRTSTGLVDLGLRSPDYANKRGTPPRADHLAELVPSLEKEEGDRLTLYLKTLYRTYLTSLCGKLSDVGRWHPLV